MRKMVLPNNCTSTEIWCTINYKFLYQYLFVFSLRFANRRIKFDCNNYRARLLWNALSGGRFVVRILSHHRTGNNASVLVDWCRLGALHWTGFRLNSLWSVYFVEQKPLL